MKIKHRLLLAVATLATVSSSASVVVRLAPGGIVIHCDIPNLNVTLDWPRMRGDDGERVAKVEALGDREASLSYTSGTKLVLSLSEDGSLSLHAEGGTVSDRDKGILFTLGMPTDLARRGIRWAFDDAEARPLPAEKLADAFLWRADAEALKLTDAEGRGVSIGIPRSWVQLQDNRHWNNNQSFLMKSFGDLPRDGRRSFAIRALGEGGSLQIGTATPLDPHAYRPYPEPKEELWPGHGPIRTFGWQDGIRRRYHARRLQDENAVFFIRVWQR